MTPHDRRLAAANALAAQANAAAIAESRLACLPAVAEQIAREVAAR